MLRTRERRLTWVARARVLFMDDNGEIRHTYRTRTINVKRRPTCSPSNRGHLTLRARIISQTRFIRAMLRVRRGTRYRYHRARE